jgi:hypothetical protein
MEAFSLKNPYLRCIGEQIRYALNDIGHLGSIYTRLTNYILIKYGGALNIPRITSYNCGNSPITYTLCLQENPIKFQCPTRSKVAQTR